jgi:Flp pilus assembly protein TadD
MQVIARDSGSIEGTLDPTPERHQALEEIASLRARLRDMPSDHEARVDLARALIECGETGEAFLHLRVASAPGSQRAQASYLMGLAHIWSGDHSAAIDDLLLAARLLPAPAPALVALDVALGEIAGRADPDKRDAGASPQQDRVPRVNALPLQLAHSAAA